MFIGDSVSVNQRQSLLCLLHAAVPDSKIKEESTDLFSTTTFLVNELASPIKFSLISFSFLMNLVIKFHILFGLLLSPKVKTSQHANNVKLTCQFFFFFFNNKISMLVSIKDVTTQKLHTYQSYLPMYLEPGL